MVGEDNRHRDHPRPGGVLERRFCTVGRADPSQGWGAVPDLLRSGYNKAIPYHNWFHAVDVAHATWRLANLCPLALEAFEGRYISLFFLPEVVFSRTHLQDTHSILRSVKPWFPADVPFFNAFLDVSPSSCRSPRSRPQLVYRSRCHRTASTGSGDEPWTAGTDRGTGRGTGRKPADPDPDMVPCVWTQ